MGRETTDAEVQQVYDEFWKRIVEPDGELDIKQVKKELFDFRIMMQEVPKVYDAVTGGKFAKPLTEAQAVIDAAEAHYSDWYTEEWEREVVQLVTFSNLAPHEVKEMLELVGVSLGQPGYTVKLILKAIKATPHLQDLIRVAELVEVAGDTDIVCPFCAVVGDRDHLSDCLVTRYLA